MGRTSTFRKAQEIKAELDRAARAAQEAESEPAPPSDPSPAAGGES